jgi:hypothetical protein
MSQATTRIGGVRGDRQVDEAFARSLSPPRHPLPLDRVPPA